jgi:hypothetical protein
MRRIDIRKPVHAVAIGAILAGVLAPTLAWMAENERYRLNGTGVADIMTHSNPALSAKVTYDKDALANVFNAKGDWDTGSNTGNTGAVSAGGGGKGDKQLYSATLPDDSSTGIKVSDNVNKTSVSMTPDYPLMGGRMVSGHEVYPLKDQAGQLVLTPKANGLKEDIVLDHFSRDAAKFSYDLNLKHGLVARLRPEGSVGIYAADPALYGNISFSSDADRQQVEKARENGPKSYLMYEIPAPVIKQSASGGNNYARAHFTLLGNTLNVEADGLSKARYPLSIDPSFVVTTASDFNLGRLEDNVTVTTPSGDGQINRATLTGGLVSSWSATAATACASNVYNGAATAYNGFIYTAGGSGSNNVCIAQIQGSGALGASWTQSAKTLPYSSAPVGAQLVGYNGYLYVWAGEDSTGHTQFNNAYYAQIDSASAGGDVCTAVAGSCRTNGWTATSSLNTARAYPGAAVYNDHLYTCGGSTAQKDTVPTSSCEYVVINSDGTLGTWTTTTALPNVPRSKFGMAVYNNYLYIGGGNDAGTEESDVWFAPITSTYTIGTWVQTTSIAINGSTSTWRNGGFVAEEGYIYIVGGCTTAAGCSNDLSTVEYVPINADGTLGTWDQTSAITTARFGAPTVSYNGVLYMTNGCTTEPSSGGNNCNGQVTDTQYAIINASVHSAVTSPGDVVTPAASTSISTARFGAATTAYNGFLYAAGGCTTGAAGPGCAAASSSTTVSFATIQDDGTLSAWTNSTHALPVALFGGSLMGYGGKLYFVGGSAPGGTGTQNVFSATISAGDPTWTDDGAANANNKIRTARYWAAGTVYENYLYVVGGKGTNSINTVEFTKISATGAYTAPTCTGGTLSNGGTTGLWCEVTNNTFATARAGAGAVAADGFLYVFGGDNNGTYQTSTERSPLPSSTGYPGAFCTNSGACTVAQAALPSARAYVSAAIVNNVMYSWGGLTSTPTASNSFNYGVIDSSGNLTSWTASGRTLAAARWGSGGGSYNGRAYSIGGCSSNSATCAANLASSEVVLPDDGGTGMTGQGATTTSWTAATNAIPTAMADFASVVYNGIVYSIGGCTVYTSGVCSTFSTAVRHSAIQSDGSLGAWSATSGAGSDTQLGAGRSYSQAVAYNGFIFLFGGQISGTAADATVQVGTISATGPITAWTSAGGGYNLPAGRSALGAATSNGFVYVAGGCASWTSSTCNTRQTDVIFSQVGSNGSLVAPQSCSGGSISGVWCTGSVSFSSPTANSGRYDLSVAAYNSNLYVVGGYDGTSNLSDVQYASLNSSTGAVGSFSFTNFQDLAGRARPAVGANGFMYYFGNETTGTDVKDMPINANGTLGNLEHASTNGMANAHTHGAVVFFNGFFYAMGGCTVSSGTCGAVNTNTEYVGQKANARVGHYSKLFNTVVNTAPSQVLLNGTGQYLVTMQTAAQGAASLGVAQNFDPAYPGQVYTLQALDSGGTNVGIAFNYYIFLTINDSQTGTFPDTASDVTDINIYYHANPGFRLRHGASFTTTGCSGVLGASQGCILDTAP